MNEFDKIFFDIKEDTRADFIIATDMYARYLMQHRYKGRIVDKYDDDMMWIILHMNRTYYLYRDFKSIRVIKSALKLRDDFIKYCKENCLKFGDGERLEDPELYLNSLNDLYPTILEVFIAVAEYKSQDIEHTQACFKHMLNNLSLYDVMTYSELEKHLNNFIFGYYGFDGTGDNVFRFKDYDIRGLDLFDQKKKFIKECRSNMRSLMESLLNACGGNQNENDK